MRYLYLLTILSLGFITGAKAQVNIASAKANPKTFIFDDDKHTVHGYIYNSLKENTSCCSNDAIYLEVKFDESGYVTSAKTLTGKNDCYRSSVTDIVKNVRWDATGVKGTKTIYFEVKPIIPCSGAPDENQYKPVAISNNPNFGGVASSDNNSGTSTNNTVVEEEEEEPVVAMEEEEEEEEEPVVVEEEEEEEMGGDPFANDEEEESSSSDEEEEEVVTTVVEEEEEEEPVVVEEEEEEEEEVVATTTNNTAKDEGWLSNNTASNNNHSVGYKESAATPSNRTPGNGNGNVKVPPQASDIEYVSKGDRKPDESHTDSHKNLNPSTVGVPKYTNDESQLAITIKSELRKTGYCGLAQAAIELTVDPRGNVVDSRVVYSNTDKIDNIVPSVVKQLKFASKPVRYNYRSYVEFKTDIICNGSATVEDISSVPNVIKR